MISPNRLKLLLRPINRNRNVTNITFCPRQRNFWPLRRRGNVRKTRNKTGITRSFRPHPGSGNRITGKTVKTGNFQRVRTIMTQDEFDGRQGLAITPIGLTQVSGRTASKNTITTSPLNHTLRRGINPIISKPRRVTHYPGNIVRGRQGTILINRVN